MLYRVGNGGSTACFVPPSVSGYYIARHAGERSALESAFLGARLWRGQLQLTKPTAIQSAGIVGVCSRYVRAAASIIDNPSTVHAVLSGRLSLVAAAQGESLTDRFIRSSAAEKLAAAETIGPAVLWDEMVEPLLND
jgi:hypothetical protein